MAKAVPDILSAYPHSHTIGTRWMDNDVYGHVNNVVYYAWFDTVVNQWLIAQELLDFAHGSMIGLVVETQCSYFAPVAFPDVITAGLRVAHVGRSSVRYEVGLFANGSTQAAAQGHFIHVYVDRLTRKPVALPEKWRISLQSIAALPNHS
jgi:acyl-CoA thioester hydrolase